MVNHIRRLLLFLALGIVAVFGFYLLSAEKQPVENVENTDVNASDSGFDIEIENFKVVHEVAGEKDWELNADLAQMDQEKDLTLLQNVKLKMNRGENKEFRVVADSGSIKNESQEINLEGNVKMIGDSTLVGERVQKNRPEPEQ